MDRQKIIDCLEDALERNHSPSFKPFSCIVPRRVVKEAIELIKFKQQQVEFLEKQVVCKSKSLFNAKTEAIK
jgi:hypothetical protein